MRRLVSVGLRSLLGAFTLEEVVSDTLIVVVPMRAWKTRTGNSIHLAPARLTKILCGGGLANEGPLRSDQVTMAGKKEGAEPMCQTCKSIALLAKMQAGERSKRKAK